MQRALLEQYHVDDPVTFYNVRDKWTVPDDPAATTGGDQPPYYVLADPPGTPASTEPQFQLTTPMMVNNKHQPRGLHLASTAIPGRTTAR